MIKDNVSSKRKIITLLFTVTLILSVITVAVNIPVSEAVVLPLRALQWQRTDTYLDADATASLTEAVTDISAANAYYVDTWLLRSSSTITPYYARETEYQAACDKINAEGKTLVIRIRINSQGSMNPSNKTEFFETFEDSAVYWATFAEANGAEYFFIATEFTQLELAVYTTQWQSVISAVRVVFSGSVCYETNFWVQNTGTTGSRDQKYSQAWFADLDYLGVSAYWDIAATKDWTVTQMINEWYDFGWLHTNVVTEQVGNISTAHGVDIILVTGCPSYDGAAMHPWNWTEDPSHVVDLVEQERWFQSFFQVWYDVSYVHGFMIDGAVFTDADYDPDNDEFTIMNKPAETTVQAWFTTSNYLPTEDAAYYFYDSFETGDFGNWSGTFTTNILYANVTVDDNNPSEGTYNLNASLIKNVNNYYTCAYQNISGIGDTTYIRAENVMFDSFPNEAEGMYFIGAGTNITAGTMIARAGVRNDSGVYRWTIKGLITGTTMADWNGTSTPVLGDNYILQLAVLSSATGWYRLYVNGTLEVEVTGVDNSARSLNYIAAGLIGSYSANEVNAHLYLDSVSANASYTENRYLLWMDTTVGGTVNPYPSNTSFTFFAGTNLTLTATAYWGYEFTAWEIDGVNVTTTEAVYYLYIDADHTAKAYFTAGVVHGGIFNITVVGSNYNLTQGSDGIPHYYGNNASYALNYVVSRGEAVYLGEGNYSDNGAVIDYLGFADGALICAEPDASVYIRCGLYRIINGSAVISDVVLRDY